MDKKEILEKSRMENQNKDLAELEVVYKASNIAQRIGMLVCCITAVLEVALTETVSFGSWTIYFSILSTLFIVKYVKMRRTHELLMAILCTACFVLFFVFFVLRLAGVR